ncbi:putative ABC transport system permease protein [Cohaesibacter sp. ES.047]|uniref:ABC transporter permease n=1 Tax=Cohaesibacter sp. ES.047 TaxID=1798205 RepID=UPI000BB7C6CE|nr:FtsX-like permease family protein [Cohaesibacter sp. ES.047]SNY90595.1 putative ABC transport system permease protein [Cohaesibacter sp. ES.047]
MTHSTVDPALTGQSRSTRIRAQGGRLANLGLAFRFAFRELRGGLAGFYIFLACIALGVAAIGGVGSASKALTGGLEERGSEILGGDISLSAIHTRIKDDQRAYLSQFGRLGDLATLRAMARTADASQQMLIEVKAVDDAYPLVGTLETRNNTALSDGEVLADPMLLERLGLSIGDDLVIGVKRFKIGDVVTFAPDELAGGVAFGPPVLMKLEDLDGTELLQPGAIVRWTTRLAMPGNPDLQAVNGVIEQIREAYPDNGWRVRSRANAAQGLSRNIERFAAFLVLVGLASLITGGVGIANAVRAFVASRQATIASYKCLGAPSWLIVEIYLAQILIITLIGIAIGLVFAAIVPFILAALLPANLPLSASLFHPAQLGIAALFGVLAALLFSMRPLLRARSIPATALFRDQIAPVRTRATKTDWLIMAGLGLLLVGLVLATSEELWVSASFLAGMVVVFGLLRLIAFAIMLGARHMPRIRRVVPRLAVANLHRPGALTPSVALSLGLGLSLLVTLVLIDLNLRQQLTGTLRDQAPNFFFVNIQNSEVDAFEARLDSLAPGGERERVPMLRGRITSLKGIPTSEYEAGEGARWVLRGDRGITYSAVPPENSKIVGGDWWPEDYSGKPLVSFDAEIAEELNLSIGDKITVNVLGRTIEAELANVRTVEWQSLGINFVMVFSPNTFAGAPHAHLATLALPDQPGETADALRSKESGIMKAVIEDFPAVTTVRVGEALERVNDLVRQLAWGMRAASSLAVIASILVLAGALAAGQRERIYDAVILKTLGASRAQVLTAYCLEYGMLGFTTAIFALVIGHVAAFLVITEVMEMSFAWQPVASIVAVLVAMVVTIILGLLGTWSSLNRKPARILRTG